MTTTADAGIDDITSEEQARQAGYDDGYEDGPEVGKRDALATVAEIDELTYGPFDVSIDEIKTGEYGDDAGVGVRVLHCIEVTLPGPRLTRTSALRLSRGLANAVATFNGGNGRPPGSPTPPGHMLPPGRSGRGSGL